MGINDLLAQISGDGGKIRSRPDAETHKGPKRKAENELGGVSSKIQRTLSVSDGASTTTPGSKAPSQTLGRPLAGSSSSSKISTQPRPRPVTEINKPASSARSAKASPSALIREPASAVTSAVKATPKKGSYQEILARAQKAQAAMGQVGKIQHKALEKGPTKRERQEMKAQQTKGAKRRTAGADGRAHSATSQRAGPLPQDQRQPNGASKKLSGVSEPKTGMAEDKKPKKAALATTGYRGTARPRPDAAGLKTGASDAESTTMSRDGSRPLAFPRAQRSRLDEYDEMDDFIDDDEEEDDGDNLAGYENGRMQKSYHHYMSEEEDESDMEAGMSDIDHEERRAELWARKEDQEQEKIERDLKNKKEERRRQYAQLGDARRAR